MKKTTTYSVMLMLALSFLAYAGESDRKIFRGEISDSQCALNVHSLTRSHQEMYQSKSGSAGKTPASCSLHCVDHLGGSFVLSSKTHVYRLDNQALPRAFAGEKVKVEGILDPKTDTIHVMSIEAE